MGRKFPNPTEYQDAVQNPSNFSDPELKLGTVVSGAMGLPAACTGNFGAVYKVQCSASDYAVKCFFNDIPDQQERYRAVGEHLKRSKLPYAVDFTFMEQGIRVRGEWYPIVKMAWVNGELLYDYINRNLNNAAVLTKLAADFQDMASNLRAHKIAHGDLQGGNVLVIQDELRLVDYDGMFVPGLAGKKATELGLPNFQHPKRRAQHFGLYLDHFSFWVIYTSLQALIQDPKLWPKYDGGDDKLLFAKIDYANPEQSAVFTELCGHPDPTVSYLAGFVKSLIGQDIDSLPPLQQVVSLPMSKVALYAAAAIALIGLGVGAWFLMNHHQLQPHPPQPPRIIRPPSTSTTTESPTSTTTDASTSTTTDAPISTDTESRDDHPISNIDVDHNRPHQVVHHPPQDIVKRPTDQTPDKKIAIVPPTPVQTQTPLQPISGDDFRSLQEQISNESEYWTESKSFVGGVIKQFDKARSTPQPSTVASAGEDLNGIRPHYARDLRAARDASQKMSATIATQIDNVSHELDAMTSQTNVDELYAKKLKWQLNQLKDQLSKLATKVDEVSTMCSIVDNIPHGSVPPMAVFPAGSAMEERDFSELCRTLKLQEDYWRDRYRYAKELAALAKKQQGANMTASSTLGLNLAALQPACADQLHACQTAALEVNDLIHQKIADLGETDAFAGGGGNAGADGDSRKRNKQVKKLVEQLNNVQKSLGDLTALNQ